MCALRVNSPVMQSKMCILLGGTFSMLGSTLEWWVLMYQLSTLLTTRWHCSFLSQICKGLHKPYTVASL